MAHIATIVNDRQCTLLEHGKKTVWQWCRAVEVQHVILSRGKQTRQYRVVEKIAERQYRVTLEDNLTA